MPDIRLPADIEEVANVIPAWPRGLAELRLRLATLPPLSPNRLPGSTLSEFPADDGTVATTGTGSGGSAESALTTGEAPGTITGPAIGPGTLPSAVLAGNLRPPKIVSSLPTLPNAGFPVGTLVYNTGDSPPRLYRNNEVEGTETWEAGVSGDDIVANSITAGQIQAGAIGATELATSILLASVIKTAETGDRLEFSNAGIALYNSSGGLKAWMPTNGDPIFFKGEFEAENLVSTTAAEFRGTARVAPAATLEIADKLTAPNNSPTLSQGPESTVQAGTASGSDYANGLCWDSTASGWILARDNGVYYDLIRVNPTTGAVTDEFIGGAGATKGGVHGVATDGTYVYVLLKQQWTLPPYYTYRINKHLRSDLSYSTGADVSTNLYAQSQASIAWDSSASELVAFGKPAAIGNLSAIRFNSSLAYQSSTSITGCSGSTVSAAAMTSGYYWLRMITSGTVQKVDSSTHAYVSNADFDEDGYAAYGLAYDGTNFFGRDLSRVISKFTNWDWTTESAVYWVGYSWYDSDSTGGTHETPASARASITMKRRLALQVTTATIPDYGGTDDPDSVRVYAERNASEPSAGSYHLQVTDSLTTRKLTTFATGGAADPTSNSFPSATPGEVSSEIAGWAFRGDGTASLPGLIQTGTEAVSASSATYGDGDVTFATEFPGAPIAVATVGALSSVYVVTVGPASSTGFTIRLFRRDGASFTATVNVNWVAIYGQD